MVTTLFDIPGLNPNLNIRSLSGKHAGYLGTKTIGVGDTIIYSCGFTTYADVLYESGLWNGDLSFLTVQGDKAFHVNLVVVVYDLDADSIIATYTLWSAPGAAVTGETFLGLYEDFKHDGFPMIEPFNMEAGGHNIHVFSGIEIVNDDGADSCVTTCIPFIKLKS